MKEFKVHWFDRIAHPIPGGQFVWIYDRMFDEITLWRGTRAQADKVDDGYTHWAFANIVKPVKPSV